MKWQSALEGFRWSIDYLLQRLRAFDIALLLVAITPLSGKRGFAHDVLVYPFVDIHFLKQNVDALDELHRVRQELALERIAYFFEAQDDAVSDKESEVKDQQMEEHGSENIDNMAHEIKGKAHGDEVPPRTSSVINLPPPQEDDGIDIHGRQEALIANGNSERSVQLHSQQEDGHKPQDDDKKTMLSTKPPKAIVKHSQTHANLVGQQAESILRGSCCTSSFCQRPTVEEWWLPLLQWGGSCADVYASPASCSKCK